MKKVMGIMPDGKEFTIRDLTEDEQTKLTKLNVQFENQPVLVKKWNVTDLLSFLIHSKHAGNLINLKSANK